MAHRSFFLGRCILVITGAASFGQRSVRYSFDHFEPRRVIIASQAPGCNSMLHQVRRFPEGVHYTSDVNDDWRDGERLCELLVNV